MICSALAATGMTWQTTIVSDIFCYEQKWQNFNMQCFGGYWNDMADNPAGWSAHLDASCNYIANTAVRFNVQQRAVQHNLYQEHFNFLSAGRQLANLCWRVQFGSDRVPEIPQRRIPHPICPSRCKKFIWPCLCLHYSFGSSKRPKLTKYFFYQASESACAYYNSNFDSYPGEYIDFLKSYFIAQIDAFEYGDKVTSARLW